MGTVVIPSGGLHERNDLDPVAQGFIYSNTLRRERATSGEENTVRKGERKKKSTICTIWADSLQRPSSIKIQTARRPWMQPTGLTFLRHAAEGEEWKIDLGTEIENNLPIFWVYKKGSNARKGSNQRLHFSICRRNFFHLMPKLCLFIRHTYLNLLK